MCRQHPCAAATVIGAAALLTACAQAPPATSLDREPPRIVNAFYGLDDALPEAANLICEEAPGLDGMPVTFSRRVRSEGPRGRVNPAAFTVTTESNATKTPVCATLAPALGALEGHTVLLVGDLGDDERDPPRRVDVTGSLPLAGDADGQGLSGDVTPLAQGPVLVLALGYRADEVSSDCPSSTTQIVMVVWAGGVQPVEGRDEEDHRQMYSVLLDGEPVVPFALGDLDDPDNYVHLCLDAEGTPSEVSAAAGVLVDPNDDVNPASSVDVAR
jgi:hypothetical protein